MVASKAPLSLIIASVALFLCIAPIAALIEWPDAVQRSALGEKLWYVALVFLGIGAATTLYALYARSHASYNGQVLGGTLAISGPAALVVLFVVMGFALPPKPDSKFDVTVFLKPPVGADPATVKGMQLTVDMGSDRRIEFVDEKGAFRFIGVPSDLAGRTVDVSLKSPLYAAPADVRLMLSREPMYLPVQWKTWQLQGSVEDPDGKPVAGANVRLADQHALTEVQGRFSFLVSAQTADALRVLEVNKAGHLTWRGGVGLGVESVAVQLDRMR